MTVHMQLRESFVFKPICVLFKHLMLNFQRLKKNLVHFVLLYVYILLTDIAVGGNDDGFDVAIACVCF